VILKVLLNEKSHWRVPGERSVFIPMLPTCNTGGIRTVECRDVPEHLWSGMGRNGLMPVALQELAF